MPRTDLTQEGLKQAYSYDPETGLFTRLISKGKWKAGTVSGSLSNGYVQVWLNGFPWKAHRLAWLYMTGRWPLGDIDHIDRNRSNNRWSNLRDVSRSVNAHNGGNYRHNKSGHRGVSWDKSRLVWKAYRYLDGNRCHLGNFKTKEGAITAVQKFEAKHGIGISQANKAFQAEDAH